VRVKPEGLVKGQEWKQGCVVKNHGSPSYAVEVDGKLLRRNRVHLKQDEQVTQPNLTSDTRKSKEQTEVPARQKIKVKPTRQTTTITEPPKCAKKMELRSSPNECKIVNFTGGKVLEDGIPVQ